MEKVYHDNFLVNNSARDEVLNSTWPLSGLHKLTDIEVNLKKKKKS